MKPHRSAVRKIPGGAKTASDLVRHRKRPFKNGPEENFAALAVRLGWKATKRGWPDFLCFDKRNSVWCAVEVKPRDANGQLGLLQPEQIACLDLFSGLGLRCFVSDGFTIEQYDEKHRRGLPARDSFAALRGPFAPPDNPLVFIGSRGSVRGPSRGALND